MHEVLANHLFKLVQEKVKTDRPIMTIAVDWNVKQQKQTNKPDYIRASTQDFGTIAQMRPLNMSYCGARDLLRLLQPYVYKSSKVSSEAL